MDELDDPENTGEELAETRETALAACWCEDTAAAASSAARRCSFSVVTTCSCCWSADPMARMDWFSSRSRASSAAASGLSGSWDGDGPLDEGPDDGWVCDMAMEERSVEVVSKPL